MLIAAHDRRIRPWSFQRTDENTFSDDQAGRGALGVVFDACWARFEIIDVAVAGQGAHYDPIAELEGLADGCGLQEDGHCDELGDRGVVCEMAMLVAGVR
jgi:hypothetical protein